MRSPFRLPWRRRGPGVRVEVVRVGPHDGPDALTAARAATDATHLVPVRSCDELLPGALEAFTAAAAAEPERVLLGRVSRRGRQDPWFEEAQAIGAFGLAGSCLPVAVWRGGHDRDDWLLAPSVAAAAAAAGVRRLDRTTCAWAPGDGRLAFGAYPDPLAGLEERLARWAETTAAVIGTPLAGDWDALRAGAELAGLLAASERADDETWSRLVVLARAEGDPDPRVGAAASSLLWLAAHGRRADVEALAEEVQTEPMAAQVVGPDAVAEWTAVTGVPASRRRLARREAPLLAKVHRVARAGDGLLVDVFVRVPHVDPAAAAVEATDAGGVPVPAVRHPDPVANRWAQDPVVDAAPQALRLRLAGPGPVRLALATGDFRRETTLEVGGPPPAPQGDPVVTGVGDHAARQRLAALVARTAAATALPTDLLTEHHRVHVEAPRADGTVHAHAGPPLADDELGAYHQRRLQRAYRAASDPVDPALVYVETFAGRSAAGDPLAVVERLRELAPHLDVRWGVIDHDQATPHGVTPVVIRTRAWYDALARAGLVITSTDVEPWFRKRPGQVLLQCFHGYPSKAMGRMQWERLTLPPSRVHELRRRGVETWDLILTPTPAMTEVYREQYAYTGAATGSGYPRNDALTAPDADERRARVRAALGIEPDQQVLLYAPTWRDHLATRARAAAHPELFDAEAAARALGRGHVLLLRGHRFHAPREVGIDPAAAEVVDVTDHPDVNDLVLASDVAVLDYSSLRFDYALTGRPMVFLVPDLAEYAGTTRGFLFPFEESAPGPLVSTTAEVVAAVRDLDRLRAEWGDRIAAFNATYNPFQDGHASDRVARQVLDLLAGEHME